MTVDLAGVGPGVARAEAGSCWLCLFGTSAWGVGALAPAGRASGGLLWRVVSAAQTLVVGSSG